MSPLAAEDGYGFYDTYFELTGAAALPPRHGMGFMATYWGYKNMEQVEHADTYAHCHSYSRTILRWRVT
jgi:alpha-glucosidase (family GH31 glycosyl hydrolase)